MKTADALALAKAHPDVVGSVLGLLASAVQADPSLVGDIITAIETKSYMPLLVKHLGVVSQLLGLISAKPELAAALGTALTPHA